MKLKTLIEACRPARVVGPTTGEVTGIEIDSRKIEAGNLFIAMRGTQVDGHAYIAKAQEMGATAVACESLPEKPASDVTYLLYPNTEDVAGVLATQFYGNPTSRLKLVGVTGTNGKTTIATLLYHMFRRMGYKCGLCSTVCNYIDGRPV
ncbi:MAG: UDP-N-acetylmuramoyl-L-alanyl-D-glutamate--2,6-diaminopimelate ligase, partial [Bacteroidaceae bacterium]|nr:UDP-N-acetylmuramoyl-L-alanyl-D-glutamate--2,6-diaminopimelate ligase [Bacteroidaceae bacterium]